MEGDGPFGTLFYILGMREWGGDPPLGPPELLGRIEAAMAKKSDEIKIFISSRDSVCDDCGEELGQGAWIHLAGERGALCLSCADLDHLVFLPAGDAALTRRSKKYSVLWAVVLKWSRARKRYERQGLLIEEEALVRAETECLEDADVRARQRERAALRRAETDRRYVDEFAVKVRELYPACPPGREQVIAEHACRKYSERVGRSAAAKSFEDKAIHLAVQAHVRHRETDYDRYLADGHDRLGARAVAGGEVARVLDAWRAVELVPS